MNRFVAALTALVFVLATSGSAFAKNCTVGCSCGNTCISCSETCHVDDGKELSDADIGLIIGLTVGMAVLLIGGLALYQHQQSSAQVDALPLLDVQVGADNVFVTGGVRF